MILITFSFIVLSIYLLHVYVSWNFKYWKKRNVPFLKPVPFFGNVFRVITWKISLQEFLREIYETVKVPFIGFFIFGTPHILIRDEELLKNILMKDFLYFPDHAVHHSECELSGNIWICLKFKKMVSLRKKLTLLFSPGQMKNLLRTTNEVSEDLMEYIEKHHKENSIETKQMFHKYSTDIIAKTAFAVNANSFTDENAEFPKQGNLLFKDLAIRFYLYLNMPKLVDIFSVELFNFGKCNFFRRVFQNSIEMRENNPEVRNDLIDILVELKQDEEFCSKHNFRGDKILAQALTFFIAGYESTSSVLSFSIYELAFNPDVQEKARAEIENNLKKHGGVNFECLRDMVYLEMILMETLRKYPTLAVIDRECAEDYKIPGTDVIIEKGTKVMVPLLGLHYDESYFPNPEKYDPERFADKSKIPFVYMPFGKGPRACIGGRFAMLNAKLALTKILADYEVTKSSDTPEFIEIDPTNYAFASKGGIPVKFISLGHNQIPLKML